MARRALVVRACSFVRLVSSPAALPTNGCRQAIANLYGHEDLSGQIRRLLSALCPLAVAGRSTLTGCSSARCWSTLQVIIIIQSPHSTRHQAPDDTRGCSIQRLIGGASDTCEMRGIPKLACDERL